MFNSKKVYWNSRFSVFISSSGPKGPMSLCHGVASVVCRPSSVRPASVVRRPSLVRRPSTISKCFFFAISYPISIPFALYDSTRWGIRNFYTEFSNSLIMLIYANLFKNHTKCFSSFISQPILIWFALSGRAKFGTLNFYTEFWNFAPLINYGNLCKFIQKITKIVSSPSFLDRFSFCLFYLIGLGGGFKTCTQNFKIH